MLAIKNKFESHPSVESILSAPRVKHVLNTLTRKLEKQDYTLNDIMIEAIEHEKRTSGD